MLDNIDETGRMQHKKLICALRVIFVVSVLGAIVNIVVLILLSPKCRENNDTVVNSDNYISSGRPTEEIDISTGIATPDFK